VPDITALVVMAKQPQAGRTKTRLCPPFSFQQAADFYQAMLLDTFALAGSLPAVQLAAAYTPAGAGLYFARVTPPGTLNFPVEGADIGECLCRTFDFLFAQGFKKVMALNADGPSLPADHLVTACGLLDEKDIVLGPGEDGGYYLIGLKRPHPELFQGIAWSTNRVFSQTLAQAESLGLVVGLLPAWYDVDTAADAARLNHDLASLPEEALEHSRRFLAALPEGILPPYQDAPGLESPENQQEH
jgi:uncharacterized protein